MSARFFALTCALVVPAALSATGVSRGVARGREPASQHTVILVRHAEKVVSEKLGEAADDPGLTPAGTQRAKDLARLLAHAGVTRLIASNYRRTQATLEPLARLLGLTIEARTAREREALEQELIAGAAGSVTVVAGHSNTLPALAAGLGAPLPGLDAAGENLADGDYDRIFVLTLPPRGMTDVRPSVVELRYGAK